MDNFRALIKKSPSAVVLQALRTTLSMPAVMADNLIAELTRPTAKEMKWIKKIENTYWKGILIAPGISNDSDAGAIHRLQTADVVIFEVHGGGFRCGHSAMYMSAFTSWIRMFKKKRNVNAVIMSIEYGLAPKTKYPEPIFEAVNAYNHLTLDLHVSPSKVIVCGDSAGGAIALETLIRVYAPNLLTDLDAPRTNWSLPLPAGLVLSSPVVSAKTDSPSWKEFASSDMVTLKLVEQIFSEFLNVPAVALEDIPLLRLTEIRSKFDRFLPKHVLGFVGEREVMRDHIVELFEIVEAEGSIDIRLCREDYAHDWYFIREIVRMKDKPMLAQYDEVFVHFAMSAVTEAKDAPKLKLETRGFEPEIHVPLKKDRADNFALEEIVIEDTDNDDIARAETIHEVPIDKEESLPVSAELVSV